MTSLPPGPLSKWYVLYTRPKFEQKVAEEILSIDQQCYLPVVTIARKWSDRIKKIREPLFKNYVFVKTELYQKSRILQLAGVIRFVSVDGKPVPVDEKEIENIRLIADSEQKIEYEPIYSYGDRIKVISGGFSGLEGMLLKRIGKTRLLIRMPLLNQAISVEVEQEHVMLLR